MAVAAHRAQREDEARDVISTTGTAEYNGKRDEWFLGACRGGKIAQRPS